MSSRPLAHNVQPSLSNKYSVEYTRRRLWLNNLLYPSPIRMTAENRRSLQVPVACLAFVALAWFCPAAASQMGEWAWMAGSELYSRCNQAGCLSPVGVYGNVGVPAPDNTPGGRRLAATWTDSKGNFWLFGGTGTDSVGYVGNLNDLWEFNPSTKEWAWMGGNSKLPSERSPGVARSLWNAGGIIPGKLSRRTTAVCNVGRPEREFMAVWRRGLRHGRKPHWKSSVQRSLGLQSLHDGMDMGKRKQYRRDEHIR
jgi:hypothetical protein